MIHLSKKNNIKQLNELYQLIKQILHTKIDFIIQIGSNSSIVSQSGDTSREKNYEILVNKE